MLNPSTYINNILTDIQVELESEFDKNFERKGFFASKWQRTKYPNHTGSLMNRTGKLRRSITARATKKSVIFESNMPYARIHNEGGSITVSRKMKAYFWYKYKETKQDKYKYMAMKKAGSKINIPKRQFIGRSPEVDKFIEVIIDNEFKNFTRDLTKLVRQKIEKR